MVQVPSTNTVKESRHVAISGLPSTLPDDRLQLHFTKFGEIQRLVRQHGNPEIVLVSYMDARGALRARSTKPQFEDSIEYKISAYIPEPTQNSSMASMSSTPSSGQSSSPRNAELSPQRYGDTRGAEVKSPSFRNQMEARRGGPHLSVQSQQRHSREYWPIPEFPSESTACVVYEIQSGSTPERDLFELVKKHSKRSGVPIDIQLESTTEPGWKKARVHYYRLDTDGLKADKSLILGRPPKFRVYYPTSGEQKHPQCHPSTSYAIPKLKGDHLLKASCSVHVPHLDRHSPDHYRRRFESYGQVIDVDMVKSNDNKAFAVVQFTNIDDAQKALQDTNIPKPMSYQSRPSHRIIIFYLPIECTNEEIMLIIRSLSDRIVDICVDWWDRSAVITLDDMEPANLLLKRMKLVGRNNFGEHKVAVDFCSDRFNLYFINRKKENIEVAARSSSPTSKSENDQGSSSPSSSRDRQNLHDPLQTRSSVEHHTNQEDQENNASGSDSSSDSDSEEGSSSSNEDSDEQNDVDEEDDEDVVSEEKRHEPEEGKSSSPGNGHRDESNGDKDHEDSSERFSQPSTSSHHETSHSPEKDSEAYQSRSFSPLNYQSQSPGYEFLESKEIKQEFSPTTSSASSSDLELDMEMPDNPLTRMLERMHWRPFIDVSSFVNRIDEIVELNQKARASYEKFTGRPFPKCNNDEVLSIQKIVFHEPRDYYYYENPCSELEVRIRDWRKLSDTADLDDFRATDSKELGRDQPAGGRTSGRPSLDESRTNRLSFDSTHHPAELAQRSHSLCIGPMTPSTPFPTSQPLLVNTTHLPGTSQPSTSGGITTPRSSQPPPLMSPVSRHNSMSSTGRPASIQTLRHQSVMFPPDVSIPPPPIPPTHDEMMAPRGTPPSRRSSETMVPLRSPPFGTPIQNLLTMPIVPPPHLIAATSTGTHSVSSSAHSTPRHSISGTPVHCEPSNSKTSQPPTPKSRPEKVQIRHDTISKSGPSNAINALQARSQSMTSGDPKKSAPSTPVVRDAGSDLVAQIMSNQPNLGLRKLPRIEKKSSALQNIQNHQPPHSNANSTPSTPSTSTHQAMFKDKEKERKKKEKEKEEREREARREMKRKETKEERNKRKEMERAKRLEDERQERKREKKKERDERKKEKEKVRKKAEKEKLKKKKHRKGDSSDESDSDSNDELDLDVRKSTKEMTQEEKDHQLALLLSKGGIIENLKSRRRSDKRAHDSFEKMQQKSQQRRVLIESSDDEGGKDGDKGNSSNGEESDSEKADLPPPPAPPSLSESADQRLKVLKEREKGELTTSSDDEDHNDAGEIHQQRLTEDRENRKRQKSLTAYSSDEQGERKNVPKRMRRDDSEDAAAKHPGWSAKDDQKQRKRKLEHRRSSEDESKKNAKRDFRDIPHEDVSDEEETEDGSRSRRQSTSSTISNVTAKERKEKSGKTPLRIVPEPTGTPLLSPKILSPKHLSPKTSTSSTKRSSISDHENLISPRQRNRTTSSTSTATTSSKHEALSIPEKPLSPPVTAKSSVSSIDDPSIRDEFSMNSAADSPMSTTGRPMVLTKAAMKAFNSTPPKKKNSSSGQHDSSSGSSSDSSSSDGSTSSDDSSDDEVPKQTEPVTSIPVVASDNGSPENVVVETPSIVSQTPREPEPFTISEQSSESEPEAVPECPEASVEPQMETSQNVEPVSEEHEDSHEHGDSEVAVESQQQPLEHQEEKEELENKILDVAAEHHEEQVQGDEDSVESSIPAPSDEPDPVTQAQEKSAHTLISDQETDQAVQSIFDEEEADEFPQYPDFGISTNEKEVSGKDPHNIKPTEPLNNGHTDLLFSPSSSAHASEKQSTKSEDDMEEDSELVVMEKEVPMEQVIAQEVHVPSEPSPMEEEVKLETSPVPKEEPIKMEESPEQTPTPDLISNNESQDTPGAVNNHLHENHDAVQTPIQLQPASQHQVAQPSPRPAVAPDSQQNGPVLVSQQSQPSPMSSQQSDMAQNLILSSKDINDLAAKLHKNPEALAQATRGDCSGIFQHLLLHAQGNGQNMTPEMLQLKAAFFAQQQENEANQMMQAKMKQQTINKDRIKEQERVKRMYEENERKVEEDRREKQRKEEERQRLAAATAAATMATQKAAEALKQKQEVPRHGFQHVLSMMTPEARSLYEQFPGLSSYINRDSIGATNGVLHLPTQSIQRPSSTASTSSNPPKAPLQPSASVNQNTIDPAEIEEIRVQRWFYKPLKMSAEEAATVMAVASSDPNPPATSTVDLAAMLQQLQAAQAAQAAQQVPVVTTASTPNPLSNLETLLSTASLANLATGGALNPLSMLALTSSLNQSSPVYQGIARVLLTMNMGQMLATHQTSELLATMNQQETLMALLAARNGLPFAMPQQNQQPQMPAQGGFAIPTVLPHMSLKRNAKDQLSVGGVSDRKKSCPLHAMIGQGQQPPPPQQPMQAVAPAPPRSPSPPRKSMFENLPPEMKEKNEMFRKEILRRLDIILLEELGAEDEEDQKPDLKQIPTSEEDTDDSKADSMGAEGSAFRRILSRSSTMGNNSGSPSASGTTSPSTSSSISSGPDSPPLEGEPLNSEFMDMLTEVAQKHREQSNTDALSAKIVDEQSFSQHFPMVWTGRLALKSTEAMINLHLINGSETFLNDVLGRQVTEENPRRDSVKILQRLRLDNGQVEHIYRILTNPEYACCLALSSVNNIENLKENDTNLKSHFIDYLINKKIAGISSLGEVETKFKSARVHVFAPGEIVNRYLSELATSLHDYLQNTDTRYLLIVFTNDKADPNMTGPPSVASLAVPPVSST